MCLFLSGRRLKYQSPPSSVILCAETYNSGCPDITTVTAVKVLAVVVVLASGGDPVGSWGPDLHFLAVGVQMYTDPRFLVPCCYTWPVIHISSADSG